MGGRSQTIGLRPSGPGCALRSRSACASQRAVASDMGVAPASDRSARRVTVALAGEA